ncbi:MAG: molybdenum cofactor guanylyltransferase [bacterium]
MSKVNAILLAGGNSSRYGKDKALICFQEKTLIEIIYSKLNSFFDKVIIVSNKDDYHFLKNAVIKKDIIKNKGPLGGIYTGLYYSDAEYNFIIGCDMPFINERYFSFLLEKIKESDFDVAAVKKDGYLEPLAALYHRRVLTLVKKNILDDNLRIKSFYADSRVKVIEKDELADYFNLDKLFFNINYPEDKLKAEYFFKLDRRQKSENGV